jgi:hypothetical protein
MAKRQTRRTISFNRQLYELVCAAAEREQISTAQWIAEAARERLVKSGVEAPATNHMRIEDVLAMKLANPTLRHRTGGGVTESRISSVVRSASGA